MSNRCITWAMAQRTGSPTTKLVLFKLADQANDDGKCWPSQATIADECEINRSTVNRHIKKLADLGLVKIIQRTKDGVSLPNVYELIGVGAQEHRGGRTGAHKPSINPHKEKEQKNARERASSAPTAKPRAKKQTIQNWLDSLGDEMAILPDDPIFRYAENTGIPDEFLHIAWFAFKDQMRDKGKLQKDWRQTFRTYVKRDFIGVWKMNREGEFFLTTAGKQAQRAMQEAATNA